MNLGLLMFLLVAFVILFGVISYNYWPGFCSIINYCPSGQICLGGQCIPNIACSSTNPCPSGQICYDSHCIPIVTCSTSNPCPSGQVCLNGKCVPNDACGSTNPCPTGQICTNGKCITECITTSIIFTLQFTNVSIGTFLRADGGSLETYSNVSPPLDTTFQFTFQKIGCADSNPNINYGDRVQLVSYNQLNAQCGAGTCSLNSPDSYACKTGSWQTFTVGSAIGKTGQVCFGDQIILTQTTGSKCSMSATTNQGNTQVFCVDGNRKEEIFTILPV